MRRTAFIAVVAALVAAAPASGAFRELRVGSSQRSIQASPGSGCGTTQSGAGLCADAAYPLKLRGTLNVRRGHAIAFDFDQVVDTVEVTTPHGAIAMQREQNGTRWVAKLPKTLPPGFMRIGVASAWTGGDQHFEAGLRVLRRTRPWVRVPRLAGPYLEAALALERRGLRWRLEPGGPRFSDSGPPVPPNAIATPARPVRGQAIRPGTRVRRGTVVLLRF